MNEIENIEGIVDWDESLLEDDENTIYVFLRKRREGEEVKEYTDDELKILLDKQNEYGHMLRKKRCKAEGN